MGSYPSRTILVVGLDGSGKSTLVEQACRPEDSKETMLIVPTTGCVRKRSCFAYGANWTFFDCGGRIEDRVLWPETMQHVDGVLFVLDSGDMDRIAELRSWAAHVMQLAARTGDRPRPVLFACNSRPDLPKERTMDARTAKEALGLQQAMHSQPVTAMDVGALDGIGLEQALSWFLQ